MQEPRIPENEIERLQALRALDVLDTPAEDRFDRLTRVAQRHFQVPIALVSLVDAERQWFKSKQGLDACETSRGISFCGHAILGGEIFCIPNALEDPRFADNPLVTGGPAIRFYAGAPLHAPNGQRVGTLCIIDSKPRRFSPEELSVLRDLADGVEAELERARLFAASEELARFKHVLDNTLDMIFMFDAETLRFNYLNEGAVRSMGYSSHELLQMHPYDIKPEFSKDQFSGLIAPLLGGEKAVLAFETAHRRKDGSEFPVSIVLQFVREGAGPGRFVAVVRDITERKSIESELRSSQNRFHAIIDTVVDGIVTIDARGSVRSFNPAAERIFGYRAEEVVGRNVNLLMPAPYRAEHDGYLHNYLSTGKKKVIGIGREVVGWRQDGSTFPMELAVSEMAVNGERMFTGIVRDITQRKAMEIAAKRYEAIIQSSDDAIMSKTLEGIITSWNPGAERLFGYRAEEMVGRPMLMLFPPEREAEEHTILGKIARGEKVEPFETQRLRKDGSKIDISVTISPIVDDTGRVIGASKIARDISERKRLDRMKSEFVSTVSHELRTPLTSIRGALGLVLGKFSGALPDKARQLLDTANRNSERLTLLINDILDLEKIESGRMEFEFAHLDLVPLAKRALEDNDGYAHNRGVRLVLDTALAAAPVRGDEHRLLQVFANLISNAVKYSPPEGEVEVSVREHPGGFRVAVRDHGQGIPEAFRTSIFQRFAQADSSDTREKGGTGLGLSITKAIVERHEGSIGYASEVGKGTVFHFTLPAAQPAIQESAAGAVGSLVLICEDNADVAAILAEMLKPEGVTCDIAATARAARTLLAKQAYRLLLLDLTLPDGDGLDFLRELRGAGATADLPVIVVSGRAEEGRLAFSGDAVAVVDWLQKPLDRARLERALREALRHKARPRILHVEDDPDVVQIAQALLEDMAEFCHAATLRGAREMLAEQSFDLVILDIGLADGSGLDLLDELRARCPVVIFSAQMPGRETAEQVTAALTKSMTSNEQLLETVKNVLRG